MGEIKVLSVNKAGNKIRSYTCMVKGQRVEIDKETLVNCIKTGRVANAKVQIYNGSTIVRINDEQVIKNRISEYYVFPNGRWYNRETNTFTLQKMTESDTSGKKVEVKYEQLQAFLRRGIVDVRGVEIDSDGKLVIGKRVYGAPIQSYADLRYLNYASNNIDFSRPSQSLIVKQLDLDHVFYMYRTTKIIADMRENSLLMVNSRVRVKLDNINRLQYYPVHPMYGLKTDGIGCCYVANNKAKMFLQIDPDGSCIYLGEMI